MLISLLRRTLANLGVYSIHKCLETVLQAWSVGCLWVETIGVFCLAYTLCHIFKTASQFLKDWSLFLLLAAAAKSLQSCPTLCDPIDGSPPGSPVPGILQARTLENSMDRGNWQATVHGITKSRIWLRNFTFTFHCHALEKEMVTHSSVLALRIPGTGEPGGLPSMGSHRVGYDWSYLAAAAEQLNWTGGWWQ